MKKHTDVDNQPCKAWHVNLETMIQHENMFQHIDDILRDQYVNMFHHVSGSLRTTFQYANLTMYRDAFCHPN